MITHIQGKLIEKNPTDVVIECNGVGYAINISLHTYSQIPDNEFLKLYTHLQVKEDSHTLYGFSSLSERRSKGKHWAVLNFSWDFTESRETPSTMVFLARNLRMLSRKSWPSWVQPGCDCQPHY